MPHILNIEIIDKTDTDLVKYYTEKIGVKSLNSGLDLCFIKNEDIVQTCLIGLGIKCQLACTGDCDGNHGYFLMSRSSIYKTPLRQANSIGLIDAPYRGE